MSAEMYEFESLPPHETINAAPAIEQDSVSLPNKHSEQLLQNAEAIYQEFRAAFNWKAEHVDELFARVAGANDDMSEVLQEKMVDLYIISLADSFVQDETRTNYKYIFEKFTRGGLTVDMIKESLHDSVFAEHILDDSYVTRHLLTTLSKMSMHQE